MKHGSFEGLWNRHEEPREAEKRKGTNWLKRMAGVGRWGVGEEVKCAAKLEKGGPSGLLQCVLRSAPHTASHTTGQCCHKPPIKPSMVVDAYIPNT